MTVQRLIDQPVPVVAAMIDDIAGRSGDAVGQPIVASCRRSPSGSVRATWAAMRLRKPPNAAREGLAYRSQFPRQAQGPVNRGGTHRL